MMGMTRTSYSISLRFPSTFEMVDFVQVISDHLGQMLHLDEDARHWIGVAVRESVINAIKHGNHSDASKLVFVDFVSTPSAEPTELEVKVRDQGEGFDPDALPDPLAPENLLKSSGRGIFFMRSFMDDLAIRRAPEGGMEIRMVKRVAK
jgi:serine/threonine-protein kinase RsbW